MLTQKKIAFRYREYTEEPLSKAELERVLGLLGMKAADLVRKNDAAYKTAGLTGKESEAQLIALMAKHPTLLQRPIGVKGKKAVVGRPPEALLEL
ncbi:MAG: arsenate reductase (glutaredoxin) [Myxococcales bacterium]|nr:arsenate reductase (glutaredoxin) [Myxococcales bacterium]